MDDRLSNKSLNTCDECNSKYYSDTSQMSNLCPECAHILYGCRNCEHQFENGRCIFCFWNGNTTGYINKLKGKRLDKSKRILNIVEFLQNKYGAANILITDCCIDK